MNAVEFYPNLLHHPITSITSITSVAELSNYTNRRWRLPAFTSPTTCSAAKWVN